ncbi:MAG: DUF3857 domain-containing protein [Bacteroidales bacterium]|nr:DUF3857 domain-containing protein [Bacteroidales bacterium]
MIRFFIVCLCLLLGIESGSAQKYAVSNIPEGLSKNAHAVIRYSYTGFTLESLNSTSLKVVKAVTIFDKSGEEFWYYPVYYNSNTKIKSLSAALYNANGKLIRSAKKSEFDDLSAVSGFSLFEDNRMKRIRPVVNIYPATFEISYELSFNNSFSFPRWLPVPDYNAAVQEAVFEVVVPDHNSFRYIQDTIQNEPLIKSSKDGISYTWNVKNLEAVNKEPYSPPYTHSMPYVITAPSNFGYGDYEGNMESWQNLGIFISNINRDRDKLPDETVNKLKELTKNTGTLEEKVKIAYEYLQSNTRYVSIQLGIGGIQPFSAGTVDNVGYGDCKALTNYMKSILKALDITSYYTLVRAGDYLNDIRTDFTSDPFNHIILCVPNKNDTIWLECTSQTAPFGFLGNFTSNRHVLMVTEEGGKLIKTPSCTKEDTREINIASLKINADGDGFAQIQSVFTGLFYDNMRPAINSNTEEQKRYLFKLIRLPNYIISNFLFTEFKNKNPFVTLGVDLELPSYASQSGSRLLIPLNMLHANRKPPADLKERKLDIFLPNEYISIDTMSIKLPDGFDVEYLPGNTSFESVFGKYSCEIELQNNKVLFIRKFEQEKGNFPKEEYVNLVDFYKKVNKTDNSQIILKKQSVSEIL